VENVFRNIGLVKTDTNFKVILFVVLCKCFALKYMSQKNVIVVTHNFSHPVTASITITL
jgi:hypothetical protein